MKYPFIIIIPVLFIWLIQEKISAQSWEFVKEKNGIKIYTRVPEYSPFKCFKGETVFHTSIQELDLYIGNVKNFDWWDKNIEELSMIGPGSEEHMKYYFIYTVPWPLKDRDFCVEVFITKDTLNNGKVVYAKPLPGVIPERSGIVRIQNYWQRWTLVPLDENSVHAVLEGFVDPGGIVPAWLYNMVIVDTPLNVMEGIKQKVETADDK